MKKTSFRLRNFLMLTVSGIVNAIGIVLLLQPSNLYDSGFSGTSMFLSSVTGLPLAVFLLVLNLPFFIFGFRRLGAAFTVYSVYAIAIYSAASYLIPLIAEPSSVLGLSGEGSDILLGAVFGGLISGIGSGLTIRFGGAIDGIEVLSVIFAKRLGITVGTFVMVYNVVLYVLIGVVESSWIYPLYSVLTYAAAIKSVDFIVEGLDKGKAAMIITTEAAAISLRLSEEFGRGITLIPASGYYSNAEKTVVYFVVNRFQIGKLKAIVREADRNAFVTITEVSDVFSNATRDG
ncbi:MAG: YitT family protein [Bacteroides sp.]|nr:YitT family protein [Eubacterium sp.]MCM1418095.1 YitT family protein [Roseburia sp.]MCM1462281.1 YitT family protein [Bacteroides sp.]